MKIHINQSLGTFFTFSQTQRRCDDLEKNPVRQEEIRGKKGQISKPDFILVSFFCIQIVKVFLRLHLSSLSCKNVVVSLLNVFEWLTNNEVACSLLKSIKICNENWAEIFEQI